MKRFLLAVFLTQLLLTATLYSEAHTAKSVTGDNCREFHEHLLPTYSTADISYPLGICKKGNALPEDISITTLSRFPAESTQHYISKKQLPTNYSKDTRFATVNHGPTFTSRLVKVNLFGGTNPYNQAGWNNWNVTGSTNITSSNFAYSDGAGSTVSAVLSGSQGISDNGATYGGTMCPPEVLRYTTYSTIIRTLTLRGLDNALKYDLELYASRASTGNSTQFTINGVVRSVVSDHNKTNKVVFTDLTPTNGQIVISLSKTGSFNYLNGFILTEKSLLGNTNVRPIANAGADILITSPETSVQLNGSSSTDPDGSIASYQWSKIAGPSSFHINNNASSTTLVTNLVGGSYSFELSVSDNLGAVSKDTMNVTVSSGFQVLKANAGTDQTINYTAQSTTTLNGTASSYPADIVSYFWSQISGASAIIASPSSSITTVSALKTGNYTFRLTITNKEGNTSTDDINIYVIATSTTKRNAPPIISGNTTYTTFSKSISLDLTATDDNGLPVRWYISKLKAPGQALKSIAVIGSSTAKGYGVGADSQFVNVVRAYYKTAGVIDTIYNLAQSSTRIWEGMPTGYIPPKSFTSVSYPLPKPSLNLTAAKNKPGVSLILVNYPSNGYNTDTIPHVMQAMRVMRDSAARWGIPIYFTTTQARDGFSSIDEAKLGRMKDSIIKHFPHNYINFYNGFIEPGTTSMRQDLKQADNVHYNGLGHLQFAKQVMASNPISKIVSSGSRIVDPSNNRTTIDNLKPGTHYFCAAVQDRDSLWSYTTITVNVYWEPRIPNANAGPDQVIHLPKKSAQLSATASSDVDGNIVSYEWTKIAGPDSYSIDNIFSPGPFVNNLDNGTYSFKLTVTDDDGLVDTDTVSIVINQPPSAKAGEDVVLTLPMNSMQLNGTGSTDKDGIITSYKWQKVSGPAQFALSNTTTSNPILSNLTAGTYVFELTVEDNNNVSAKDSVTILINPIPNVGPVANGGSDQSITLPVNSTTIDGSTSTDSDGLIAAYFWKQVQGPNVATISHANAAQTTVSNLREGIYLFELTVADDNGATAKDTVAVKVHFIPTFTSRLVKVNLFGGTNPYNQAGWNNWNVTGYTNITSGSFTYSDGASSAVSAVLSISQGVSDNGTSYGGTMCPPEVLRYTTYSTITRTVTLRGLDNALRYDLELYASRSNTGNSTQFAVNGMVKSVVSDHNKTNKVVFTDLAPTNGQIVISLNKTGSFNYLNGFILTENAPATQITTFNSQTSPVSINEYPGNRGALLLSPNPFHSRLQLTFTNQVQGRGIVTILNSTGRITKQIKLNIKAGDNILLSMEDLPGGVYFVSAIVNGITYTQRVIKIQK